MQLNRKLIELGGTLFKKFVASLICAYFVLIDTGRAVGMAVI